MAITKADLKNIRQIVDEAIIKALEGTEWSLTTHQPSSRYDSNTFTMKVKLEKTVSGEEGVTQGERDFRRYAPTWGVDADAFGMTFAYGNEQYKLIGVNPSRPKNCFSLIRLRDNTHLICPSTFVKAGLTLSKTK